MNKNSVIHSKRLSFKNKQTASNNTINNIKNSTDNIIFGYNNSINSDYIQTKNKIIIDANSTQINNQLDTDIIKANSATFTGDIEADNVNTIGNVSGSNGIFNSITIANAINTKTLQSEHINTNYINGHHIDANILRTMILNTTNINTDNIIANKITGNIETCLINSQTDLILSVPIDHIVSLSNIKLNVNAANLSVITPVDIKSSNIFVVTQNIKLIGDASCDGIKIIIYNQSVRSININAPSLICNLPSKKAVEIVYISAVNTWISL